MLAGLIATARELMATAVGITSGAWLIRVPPAGQAETPDTARVVEYLQWNASHDPETLAAEPIYAARFDTLGLDTTAVDTELYRVATVVSRDPGGRATIEPAPPGCDLVTGIITFEPAAGKQGWIDEYNQSETRDYIQHLDGFVSASFLVSAHGQRLAEFVQWKSTGHFAAAVRDDQFREHVDVTNHYSTSQLALYRVHRTLEQPRP